MLNEFNCIITFLKFKNEGNKQEKRYKAGYQISTVYEKQSILEKCNSILT